MSDDVLRGRVADAVGEELFHQALHPLGSGQDGPTLVADAVLDLLAPIINVARAADKWAEVDDCTPDDYDLLRTAVENARPLLRGEGE